MNQTLRLLLVEDSEDDAELILNELCEAGFDPRHARVDTPEAMAAALGEAEWDAIVCDHTMPRFSAPAALQLMQERGLDVPFIIVSGAIGEETAVAAMRAGARDYILKDNLARLPPALRRELAEADGRARQRQMEAVLRQSQKLEALGRIAGAVAHDFGNFLTVMRGFGELMMEESDPERRRVLGQKMLRAAEHAEALVRQLLVFSRRQPAVRREVDLNAVVAETEPVLRRLVGPAVQVRLRLTPELWLVAADPGQMQQVLLNLVSNARDAMPDGGALTIATGNDAAEPCVVLSVADTGHGMDDQTRSRLFEPFFTTKPSGHGTGLGLSAVYGIVTGGGGSIDVESQPGQGATFRIRLPRAESGPPASPAD